MRKIYALLLVMLAIASQTVFAQTTLISPTGDGGFENGTTLTANGWQSVNSTTNQWVVGTAPGSSFYTGSRCGYISNDGGTTWAYTQTSTASHIYKDVAIPVGQNKIQVSFDWLAQGETTAWDAIVVYYTTTSVTPTTSSPSSNTNTATWTGGSGVPIGSMLWAQGTTKQTFNQTVVLPEAMAGTTIRFVISWKNDGSGGTNPPGAVDNISLTAQAPVLGDAAPINFVTSAITLTGMTVGWTDNSTNEASFRVYRSTDNVNFSQVGTVTSTTTVGTGQAYTLTQTGLDAGVTYYYRIAAVAESESPYLSGSQSTNAGALIGTKTVGTGGFYATLAEAFADITANGLSGNLNLEIITSLSNGTTTSTVPASNYFGGFTLKIYPASSGLTISSSSTTATLDLNGCKNVIIDGRVGATGTTKDLIIENTSTSGIAIRFINGANNNTVQYATVRGVSTSTTGGVITFSTAATAAIGNSNNTVSNCDIRDGASTPNNLLYSAGTSGMANTSNSIINNNIYNWGASSTTTNAILVSSNSESWTISNNSFYQTASRTNTGSVTQSVINVATGAGHTIHNNYIGGTTANAGGTAMTLVMSSGTTTTNFTAIRLALTTTGTASSVQGNTITNMSVTTASTTTSGAGSWCGILVSTGNANIGTVTGNTIGASTGTGSIQIISTSTTSNTYSVGISSASSNSVNISNNSIGSITTSSTATTTTSRQHGFMGIYNSAAGTITIHNNLVGSLTTANSIDASANQASSNLQRLTGIANDAAATLTITNNTIANLNNAYTGSGTAVTASLRGIYSSTGVATITGNTIRNLTTASAAIGTGTSATAMGIYYTSTSSGNHSISQNTIHSITCSATSSLNISLYGIYVATNTTGTNVVAKNFIHSLNSTSTSTGAIIMGIYVNGGAATYSNNIVRLGVNAAGTAITNGLLLYGIEKASATNNNFYHNTVYIGGTGVTTNASSFAFRRSGTGLDEVRNNIFMNARSNAAGTSTHFAIGLHANTTLTIGNNLYYGTGSGYKLGYVGTAGTNDYTLYDASWEAASLDANSRAGDPMFVNAAGTASNLDLHIQTGSKAEGIGAAAIASTVTDDYDGQVRSGLTPVDAGADAGDYGVAGVDVGVVSLVSPTGGCSATATVTVSVKNFATDDLDLAENNVTVTVTTPGGYNSTKVLSSGMISAGQSVNVTMDATINMSTSGAYAFTATATVSGDLDNSNDAVSVTRNVSIIGGTKTVGTGGDYATLTAAIAAYNNATCFTAPLTLTLTNSTYNAAGGETFPITINANSAAGSSYPLTIKPASGVNATITGTSNNSGALVLNGADYIIIDGSNNGSDSKNLTITNTSTTASHAAIWLSSTVAGSGASNVVIKNCNISAGSSSVTSTYGIYAAGLTISSSGTGADHDNVTVQNNNITGATVGIYARGSASTAAGANDNLVVSKNIVTVNASTTPVLGIQVGNSLNSLISENTVAVSTSGSTAAVGIAVETGFLSSTVSRNKITQVYTAGTGGYGGRGITVATGSASSDVTVANNIIYGVNGASNWTSFGNSSSMGICIGALGSATDLTTTAGGIKLYYNSIYLAGTHSYTSATLTAGIYVGTGASSLDIRNNAVVNNLDNITTSGSKNYGLYSAAASSAFTTLNYNAYYGVNSTNSTFFVGYLSTDQSTLAQWRTATGLEANSVNVDPLFKSTTDLHLSNGSTLNGLATPIAGFTVDFDGEARNGSTPDIGADEFTPILEDASVTSVTTTTTGTICSGSHTIQATVKNFGASALTAVDVQWSINTVAQTTLSLTGINIAPGASATYTLGTLSVSPGNTYEIEARTSMPNGNVDPTPANDASTLSISTQALSGTYTVGTGGNYTTLTAAAAAYNNGCLTGHVVFSLTGSSYTAGETFPITFSSNSNASSSKTLTIKPATGVTASISGSSTSSLIKFDGADYITIDGSNNGTASRNLTLTNSNTSATTSVVWLASLGSGAGATNNTIKNVNIVGGSNSVVNYGIAIGGSTIATIGADNDTTVLVNNNISNVAIGIFAKGTASTTAGAIDSLLISGNTISTNTSGVSIGVQVGNATRTTVSENTLSLETSGATSPVAISIEAGVTASWVTRNLISKVLATNTGGYGGRGITVGTGTTGSNITIANNMIYGVNGSDWTAFGNSSSMGIALGVDGTTTTITTTTGGVNLYNNSVYLSGISLGTSTSAKLTAALYVGSDASALNIRNNILVNAITNPNAATAKSYAIYSAAANTAFSEINYNNYYVSGANGVLGFLSSDRTDLTGWKTATGKDVNSKNLNPLFNSTTNLHLKNASPMNASGTPITGITVDYDGEARTSTPDIGADEYTPASEDAALSGIGFGTGSSLCPGDQPISVTVTNNGSSTLNTLKIDWTINSTAQTQASLTGLNLASGASTVITLGNLTTSSGTSYALQAIASLPNGQADPDQDNDTTRANVTIASTLAGTYTVGSGGNYATLTAAIADYNSRCITGPVTFELISANYAAETLPITILANSSAGSGRELTIKPASGVTATITGSSTSSIIKLNGADYVTIDGSNNGSSSKNLTIVNTNSGTSSAVIWIASASATDGATNNTIKNTIITGNAATTTLYGIVAGGTASIATSTLALTDNSNLVIDNNTITKAQNGILVAGLGSNLNTGLIIKNNLIGTATAGDGSAFEGIQIKYQTGAEVFGNDVQNVKQSDNATTFMYGIRVVDCKLSSVYKNLVHNMNYSGTSTEKLYGIAVSGSTFNSSGNASNNVVYNNFIYDITSTGTSTVWNSTGLFANGGFGDKFYYNTVHLAGQLNNSTAGLTAAFANGDGNLGTSSSNIDVRNNIFSISGSSAGGNVWAFYTTATAAALSTCIIDYNNLYSAGTGATNNIGRFSTATNYTTLSTWRAASSTDANSVSLNSNFVSATDLHIQNVLLNATGTAITGITTDYDGNSRDGSTPDIGADEINPPCQAPAAQPTALVLNPQASGSNISIQGSFTGTSVTSNRYLVVRTATNVAPNPVDGTTYSIGNVPDFGYVESVSNAKTFTSTSLTAATTYYYWVFAFESSCTGGPSYNVTTPLTNSAITSNPCQTPGSQPDTMTFSGISASAITMTFTAPDIAPSEYLVVRSTSATPPSPGPQDGTTYVVGSSALGGVIESISASKSVTSTGLTTGQAYYYYVYAYNNTGCSGGPLYLTTSPLSGTATTLNCPVPGTYSVGPTGTYNSLTQIGSLLATCGVTGSYIFELQSTYNSNVETFPMTIPAFAGIGSNTITIRPASGATGLSITSNNTGGTIVFDSAMNIIIDGRPGGTGSARQLTIQNTSTGTTGAAITFKRDAKSNIVRYVNVRSANTGTNSGTVVFSGTTTAGAVGVDDNTISNCHIYDADAGTPVNAIYAVGATGRVNSGNTISNNNIYNFFSAGSATNGISISSENSDWTISGNSFYQTATRTFTTGNAHNAINISSSTGNGFVISNNFIGGNTANAGGTAWTSSGSTGTFVGIRLSVGTTTATSVQGNTIANMNWTSTSTATSAPGVWTGIYVSGGNVNIGTTSGNMIGSNTGTGSVVVSVSTASSNIISFGIASASTGTVSISNNGIGSITAANTNTGGFANHGFIGIQTASSTATVTINNNTIGSTVTPASINTTGVTTSGTIQRVYGIENTCTGTVNITNNTVSNLHNSYGGSVATSTRGIMSTAGIGTVTGNTVMNVSTLSTATGTTTSAALIGIQYSSTTTGSHTIRQNIVHSLSNTAASAAVHVYGIYYAGPTAGTNLLSRNFVHSLAISSSSATSNMRGIYVNAGNATVQNNMVRLGLVADGSHVTNNFIIHGISDGAGTNNYYHNSVYVGGNSVGTGTAATYAFIGASSTTSARAIQNNIFVNGRSNGSGTGKHYAVSIPATLTGLTIDNNLYFVSGTGGVFGLLTSDRADIVAWRTATSQDINSVSGNPQFIAATGNAATVDLHIHATNPTPVEQAGIAIAAVTDDYDGSARAGLTPTDIGADAGNFAMPTAKDIQPLSLLNPLANSTLIVGSTANFTPQASFTNGGTATQTDIIVRFKILNAANTVVYNDTALISSLVSGGSATATFANAVLATGGVYTIQVSSELVGDQVPQNDLLERTVTVIAPLSGVYVVGSAEQAPFNTLTNAVARLNLVGVNGPVVFELADATYGASETFPITLNAFTGASADNRLTIKPKSGVNSTITGSNSQAILKFNGTDYVTVDGSNNGTSSRNLSIINTSTASNSAAVWLASLGTGTGASNDTIRNCQIATGTNAVGTGNATFGVYIGGPTISTTGTGNDNDNVVVTNNEISKAHYGIYARAASTGKNDNLVITNNIIGSEISSDYISRYGLDIAQANNLTISNNNIKNVVTNLAMNPFGMLVGTGVSNASIFRNVIKNVKYTGTDGWGGKGIEVTTGAAASNVTLYNNMISEIGGDSWNTANDAILGIRIGASTGGIKLYYNSVYLGSGSFAGHATSGSLSAAVHVASTATALDFRNNIFATNLVNANLATAKSYTIYSEAARTAYNFIDNNAYYTSGAQAILGYLAADKTNLVAWRAATLQDASSIDDDPLFNSPTDLHVPFTSPIDAKATPITDITVDIDGNARNASTPDIGADEVKPPLCNSVEGGTIDSTAYSVCEGTNTSKTFTVSGATTNRSGISYQWQVSNSANANYVNIAGANSLTYTTPSNLAPGKYYYRLIVKCTATTLNGISSVSVLNVNALPVVSAAVTSPVCSGETIRFTGTSNITTNASFAWTGPNGYTSTLISPSRGNASTVMAGTYSFKATVAGCASAAATVDVVVNQTPTPVNVLSSLDAICASGESSKLSVQGGQTNFSGKVGSGSVSNVGSTPYKGSFGGSKAQMIYTAAELNAIGMAAGSYITAASLDISSFTSPYTFNGFTIAMKHTPSTTLTSTLQTGTTVVYGPVAYTLSGSSPFKATHQFDNPFIWDGTSNLLVEFCFNNNNSGTANKSANVQSSSTAGVMTAFATADNSPNLCASPGSATTSSTRPNITFGFSKFANIGWTPRTGLYLDSAGTQPYNGENMINVWAKPTTTTTYNAKSNNVGCVTVSNAVTIALNTIVSPGVSISATATSIMPGTPVTFTATVKNGGSAPTYQWKLNGQNVGTNSKLYTVDTLEDMDKVVCVITSNATCVSTNTATSNIIVIRSGLSGLSQTINFPMLPIKTRFDSAAPPFNPGATATSGLQVTYISSNPAIAQVVDDTTIQIHKAGKVTITARQPGNATFNPAPPVQRLLEILPKKAQTITFSPIAAVSANAPDFNLTALAYEAGTTTPTGLTVTFVSSDPSIATVTGNTVHVIRGGTVKITAEQSGNEDYYAAPPVARTLIVGKDQQFISFSPIPVKQYGEPSFDPGAVSMREDQPGVNVPTGLRVKYLVSNTNIAGVTPTGRILIRRAGTVTITAVQEGSNSYAAAAPVSQTLVVEKGDQVVTIQPINNKTLGSAMFKPVATSSTGFKVTTFISSNSNIAEIRPGGWIKIKRTGTVTITAIHYGNHNYNSASDATTFTVTPGAGRAADSLPIVSVNGLNNLNPMRQPDHLVLYPNPVQKDATLSFKAEKTGKVSITITDANGRRVQTREEQVFAGMNNIRIHSSALRQGMYYIQVIEGDKTHQVKMLKIE